MSGRGAVLKIKGTKKPLIKRFLFITIKGVFS
jgi:hypothetical protein